MATNPPSLKKKKDAVQNLDLILATIDHLRAMMNQIFRCIQLAQSRKLTRNELYSNVKGNLDSIGLGINRLQELEKATREFMFSPALSIPIYYEPTMVHLQSKIHFKQNWHRVAKELTNYCLRNFEPMNALSLMAISTQKKRKREIQERISTLSDYLANIEKDLKTPLVIKEFASNPTILKVTCLQTFVLFIELEPVKESSIGVLGRSENISHVAIFGIDEENINLQKRSKYATFNLFTNEAKETINGIQDRCHDIDVLHQFLIWVSHFKDLFSAKCRGCGNILYSQGLDFNPVPALCRLIPAGIAFHRACLAKSRPF